jgi:hypothetical protein
MAGSVHIGVLLAQVVQQNLHVIATGKDLVAFGSFGALERCDPICSQLVDVLPDTCDQ